MSEESKKIDKGYRFREPAPATQEFMKQTSDKLVKFEITMNRVEDKMNAINNKVDEIHEFIGKADDRYAEKKVERLVYGLVALILTSVIIALLAVVIKRGI